MTIYYNHNYSSTPYRDDSQASAIGDCYCGDSRLLGVFMLYAGIAADTTSEEVREANYQSLMQHILATQPDALFSNSFNVDPAGVSRSILAWRDELVAAGWDPRSYEGNSDKLQFIKRMELNVLPKCSADCWAEILRLCSERRLLPDNARVVVTQPKETLLPNIAHILDAQQQCFGVEVEYAYIDKPCAEGNLGAIQSLLLCNTTDKITLAANDSSLNYLKFKHEDDALRYVVTQPLEDHTLYYSQLPKRLDNTLRLLGKPTCGSSQYAGEAQTTLLFSTGNKLFEYPLNINTIIDWLNMPVHPMRYALRNVLRNTIISSGGVYNAKWDEALEDYYKSFNEDERANARTETEEQLKLFLPLPQNDKMDIKQIIEFNKQLRKWAHGASSKESTYAPTIKEQLAAVCNYCDSMIILLEGATDDITPLTIERWCKRIAKPTVYPQYRAELGSRNVISTSGDIHSVANHVVWVPAFDAGTARYPFDFLNSDELKELAELGVMIYDRKHHSIMNRYASIRPLIYAQHVTIIECDKIGGECTARHPILLQLDECIVDGLKPIAQHPSMADEHLEKQTMVVNEEESYKSIQLEDGIELKERHERYTDEEKRAESYSSIDQLIQHPFNYVCERYAKIDDQEVPSAQDINRTCGNVAHRIIEKLFGNGNTMKEAARLMDESYDQIFNEAINELGLLLLRPEHTLDLARLRSGMNRVAMHNFFNILQDNGLTVIECEHIFERVQWSEASDGAVVESRADMVLRDENDNIVVLDFKWNQNGGKYQRKSLEQSTALQLYLYRMLAEREYKRSVRTAYLILPDMTLLSHNAFVNTTPIGKDISTERMEQLANGYKLRWEQLKRGFVERVEGIAVGEGEYGEKADKFNLYPIYSDDKVYYVNKFDKGHSKLK